MIHFLEKRDAQKHEMGLCFISQDRAPYYTYAQYGRYSDTYANVYFNAPEIIHFITTVLLDYFCKLCTSYVGTLRTSNIKVKLRR